ncbi:hydantoinase/oxoprolinase family protein [Natronosalvus rutilus]|uniref:Hydantoinase/oxoprolinase family protein n=1 Tax=Natronosalvus rutilus TaxID=2953753 RepID=A0A9E7NEP2_9EURY|nr:hydantoinase/oxoprolinase family protein [Natronosalvus rutilus]UTF55658.1 hydantoinase/oxoprolinase family protein [Natronosalvus rutilus]
MGQTPTGIDIGGTFTDFISVDTDDDSYQVVKTPSTKDAPERAVGDALSVSGVTTASRISHGTTVVTNAILERAGAPTALVTTAGFEDMFVIDRQDRTDIYDLHYDRGDPLVPRYRCFGVGERIHSDGEVVEPLDLEKLDEVVDVIRATDAETVAVSFLHSYANDEHEREAADYLRDCLDIPVSRSSSVLPEFREYERTNTTAVNAYTRPVAEAYLERLTDEIDAHCDAAETLIMRSDGGVVPVEEAATQPVYLGVSGPAAGVVAATEAAQNAGTSDVLTFDMGGTSADMSLVRNGEPELTTEGAIGEQSVSVPMYDIRTIGAGGGSIAHLDDGGLLKVGPESAGADPGPACYGRNGPDPTVTDANLALGLMDPEATLGGGAINLSLDAAMDVLEELGAAIDKDPLAAAEAIYELVNMNMVESARVISVQQGIDPRDFSLVAFGGAGPLHAPYIARELGMRSVIVPPQPGILSAVGLLYSDVRRTTSKTDIRRLEEVTRESLAATFDRLESNVGTNIALPDDVTVTRTVDVRFAGQAHEVRVEVPEEIDASVTERIESEFRTRHREKFGFVMGSPIELVTFRVAVLAPTDVPRLDWSTTEDAPTQKREVFLDGEFHEATVLERRALDPEFKTDGPALVEMPDSTAVVLPDQSARVDDSQNLIVETGGER